MCTRVPSRVAQTNHRAMEAPKAEATIDCCPIPSTTEAMGYADGDEVPQSTGKTSALVPEARVLY